MRKMRNMVASFMTGNPDRVGWIEQVLWFYGPYQRMQGFLLEINGEPLGYGIIRDYWITGGLVELARNKGLGRKLFSFLAERAGTEARLQVWKWNTRAFRLYESLGFVIVTESDGILTMVKGRH